MNKLVNKIALGTAQFGMDYGINNRTGKVLSSEVASILSKAAFCGIDTLDTAYGYGNSEEVIGMNTFHHKGIFKIISKLPDCISSEVYDIVCQSLSRTKQDRMYGYLIHDFECHRKDSGLFKVLRQLKNEGKIEKIGFSLYYPDQLDLLLNSFEEIDIIQVPYNVFDRRFEDHFKKTRQRGIEVHIRSTFLQGLVFKKENDLPVFFEKFKKKLTKLREISGESDESVAGLCLKFALVNVSIDKIVIGVDSVVQLEEIIGLLNNDNELTSDIDELREEDENFILPFKWKTV